MAMNISNLGGSRTTSIDAGRTQEKSSGSVGEQARANKSDSAVAQDAVVLTDQARSLGRIEQDLKSSAPDNSEKIAALKQAVTDGSYQVDAAQVAKKMGNFESQLNQIHE
jgi:negative regulator of flagellin synthesis FlgM